MDREDANELQFGSAFTADSVCLSNAEVALTLEHGKKMADARNHALTDVFTKTLTYAQRLHPDASAGQLQALRDALEALDFDDRQLFQYELVQLANLQPENSEDALSMIPSLGARFSSDEIDQMIRIWAEN